MSGNSLASSGATSIYRDFDSRAYRNIWYPVALAEKIAGKNLNKTDEADINISINRNTPWYFGTDGNTPKTSIDFVSVVLHEIAHGLGFISSADVEGQNGIFRESDYILIYDRFVKNNRQERLSAMPSPSQKLYFELTSNDLYLHSTSASRVNENVFPKIFAPEIFNIGSSISHLDESSYPPADPNSLMSPSFAAGESIHNPGAITVGILEDLGWGIKTPQNETEFLVFPNLTAGGFNLQIPEGVEMVGLKIVDMSGRVVADMTEINVSLAEEQFDISFLPKGVYQLLISSWKGTVGRRIIIE